MALAFSLKVTSFWNRHASCIILFLWVIGLYIGRQFCRGGPELISSLMRAALSCRASIVGLLCVLFLPLLLSAFAVYKSTPVILWLTVLAKGICFGFTYAAVIVSYADASWMVFILLQFADCVGINAFFWFSLRNTPRLRSSMLTDLMGCVCICLMAGAIDYWLIAPFAEALLHG